MRFLALVVSIFGFVFTDHSNAFANTRPVDVDPVVWERVTPYLMPVDHPIRAQLDHLFSSQHVLLNSKSIRAAGFKNAIPGKWSKTIVTEHSKIKGYFFKMFSESQTNIVDWELLVRRVEGAISVSRRILEFGLQEHFVVPKKWIYPIPANEGQKRFILVAEKIRIEGETKNFSKWHKKLDEERLRAIVILLQTEGLADCIRAFNLPFAKDGRTALIDLEHNHRWPVHFGELKKWLSSKNEIYLDQLIGEHVR